MVNGLMLIQKYTEHVLLTRSYTGLPDTDDPLKVKESRVFLHIRFKEWPDNRKKFLVGGIFDFLIEEPSDMGLL